MAADSLYLCPSCQSPSIETSLLFGGKANCKACGWTGEGTSLLAAPVEASPVEVPGFDQRGQVAAEFARDIGKLISNPTATEGLGLSMVRLLKRWGFLSGNALVDGKLLVPRYLKRIAAAIAEAVIAESEAIEKDRVDHAARAAQSRSPGRNALPTQACGDEGDTNQRAHVLQGRQEDVRRGLHGVAHHRSRRP